MLFAAAAFSNAVAGERTQRFAVELAVLANQSHRLLGAGLAPAQRERLRAKVDSALAVLPLLARDCFEEQRRRDDPRLLARLRRLQVVYKHGQFVTLATDLDHLSRRYPVDMRGLLPLPSAPLAVRAGRALYENLCMACHAFSDPKSPAPAPDLFAMARTLSPTQLVVSLLSGVRGTPSTTLVNPLSNQNVIDLAAYLKDGIPPKP